jgi:hypothetical protein
MPNPMEFTSGRSGVGGVTYRRYGKTLNLIHLQKYTYNANLLLRYVTIFFEENSINFFFVYWLGELIYKYMKEKDLTMDNEVNDIIDVKNDKVG